MPPLSLRGCRRVAPNLFALGECRCLRSESTHTNCGDTQSYCEATQGYRESNQDYIGDSTKDYRESKQDYSEILYFKMYIYIYSNIYIYT